MAFCQEFIETVIFFYVIFTKADSNVVGFFVKKQCSWKMDAIKH